MNSFPRLFRVLAILLANLLAVQLEAADPKLELIEVRKIWDAGNHNAFTDLIRFQDHWFCSFRESDAHVGGDGKLRILTSVDGTEWKSAALLSEDGVDLRDPKLSITPDGRLMVVAGGSIYHGTKTLQGRMPRVAFSQDGSDWTPTRKILKEGDWLWRVTWHNGQAYGVTYMTRSAADGAKGTKGFTPEWAVRLVSSEDGVEWRDETTLAVPGHPNETTLRFLKNDTCIALVRRDAKPDGPDNHAWIGTSHPPYKEWSWKDAGYHIGGPNFIELPNGAMIAAGRVYTDPSGPKTGVGLLTTDAYVPLLTLPSGGDNSYPGLVWHDELLWISYYSSHEGKGCIYLAKVKVNF